MQIRLQSPTLPQHLVVGLVDVHFRVDVDLLLVGHLWLGLDPLPGPSVTLPTHLITVCMLYGNDASGTVVRQLRTVQQPVGPLHHHVLHRVVRLLLRRDLQNHRVNVLSLGDDLLEEALTRLLGHQHH